MSKNKIVKLIILITIILVIMILSYVIYKKSPLQEKIMYSDKKITKYVENIKEIQDSIVKKDNSIKKKHKGIETDKEPPIIKNIKIDSNILDYKNKIFPKLTFEAEDISGIFRIRLYIYYNGEIIGYVQDNPNTKKNNIGAIFILDPYIILEGYKTFVDYEGATIDLVVKAWDNNENETVYEIEDKIKIIDNTPPSPVKVYWSFFFNEENKDVAVYNNKIENTFILYKGEDFPKIKDNDIEKYEYGLTTTDGAVLFKEEIPQFEENKIDIVLDIEGEGKFIFYTKAIDKNGNFTEKKINVYLDQTPPNGKLVFENGQVIPTGKTVNLYVSAIDNLSGVTNYRFGLNKADLYRAEWKHYEKYRDFITVGYKTPHSDNAYNLWYQFRDDAGNISSEENIGFYARESNTINITSKFEQKELELKIDKQDYKKGKINIKSNQIK